ncbi:MAG: NAD(+) kinase [Acidobacteria bacterium]|nr:MAG: NAD(+) kinase [Acidobacteriota bacterium]
MIRTVGIISKPRPEEVERVVPQLLERLAAFNLEVFYDSQTAACLPPDGRERPREQLPALVDLLIVLGGDGTLLAAARLLGEHTVPILPVNLGGLGFLTSVTLDELYPILQQVIEGKHRISERVLLQAEVIRDGNVVARQRALNDAVLNKGPLARMVDLNLQIDGSYVCSYKADGLIISTPTGSTAYSMAAGGPIIYPTVEAFLITPICSHTLTNRPLVVPNTNRIELDFESREEAVFLTLDGQVGVDLKRGDLVVISKVPNKLRLVRPARKTYFEILRSKLKWEER